MNKPENNPETQAHFLDRIYAHVRILSLDIVIGAVAGGRLVAYLLQPDRALWSWYLLLGISVWLVYTLDHLLDARRLGENASTPRHRFHYQYFTPLAIIWGLLALTNLALAFTLLDLKGVFFGIGLGAVVLLHLLLVKMVGEKTSPLLIKEGGVAGIYVAGIFGLPFVWEWANLEWMDWVVAFQYFLLALANLLEFSIFEMKQDEQDGQTSFVRAVGIKKSMRIVYLLLALTLVLSLTISLLAGDRQMMGVQAVIMVMAFLLGWVLSRRSKLVHHERYRALADGAFMIPAILFLLG